MDLDHLSKEKLLEKINSLEHELESWKNRAARSAEAPNLLTPIEFLHQSRLSSFIEYMPALVLVKDHELRPIFANQNFKKQFPFDQWEGKKPGELFPPDIANEMIKQDRLALDQGYISFEEDWKDMQGVPRTFYTQKFRIEVPGSDPLLGAIITDITTQKRTELELKEIEFRYKALINYSNDVIFCVDKNGYYKFVNNVFASTFGKTPEYFDGKSFWDIYPKEHADQRFEASSKMFRTGEAGFVEVEVPLPDRTLYYLAKTNPVKDESGNVLLNLTYAIDITDRKQAEEALKASEMRLAELNATKDRFFSILAHDLRSPAGMLNEFAKMLHGSYPDLSDEKRMQMIASIHNSSERISSLLENLLAWARSQMGAVSFHPVVLDLKEKLDYTLDLFNLIADKKQIRIINTLIAPVTVHADPDLLETVLRNLVSNAIKYSYPNGRILISASHENDALILAIRDEGVGIGPAELTKLFDIDKDFIKPGTGSEKGTGLGLVICKEFIQLHGGRIWAESEEGKGSFFRFSLPDKKDPS